MHKIKNKCSYKSVGSTWGLSTALSLSAQACLHQPHLGELTVQEAPILSHPHGPRTGRQGAESRRKGYTLAVEHNTHATQKG